MTDTNFEEAAVRKQAKYEDLARQARGSGYRTTILTVQVEFQTTKAFHS